MSYDNTKIQTIHDISTKSIHKYQQGVLEKGNVSCSYRHPYHGSKRKNQKGHNKWKSFKDATCHCRRNCRENQNFWSKQKKQLGKVLEGGTCKRGGGGGREIHYHRSSSVRNNWTVCASSFAANQSWSLWTGWVVRCVALGVVVWPWPRGWCTAARVPLVAERCHQRWAAPGSRTEMIRWCIAGRQTFSWSTTIAAKPRHHCLRWESWIYDLITPLTRQAT